MKQRWFLVACLAVTACGKSDATSKDRGAPASTPSAPASTPSAQPPRAAADAIPADGLAFPRVPPRVGDKVVVTSSRSRSTTVAARPGEAVTAIEARAEDTEVMAVDGDLVTKLKVAYRTFSSVETTGGVARDLPTPTAGQTYVVWREGDALAATRADGAAVSPDELATLRKHQVRVGRPDGLQEIVAARRWKVGEQVAMTPAELARVSAALGGAPDGAPIVAMGLALQSADAKVVVFALTMTIERRDAAGPGTQALTGVAKVERGAGRVLEVKLGGPIAGDAGTSGTMDAITKYTY
jgi:hypothetical protein